MGTSGVRTARAAVFTALCVTLSCGAHVLLSASPVPLPPLLAVAAAVFLIAFVLAGRERSYGRIAAGLIPLELAADTVFTTGQHACYGQGGGPVSGPLRVLGIDLLCGGGNLGTPLARMASRGGDGVATPLPADAALPWLLLAVHVGVGLLAAAWLRRGEAALARLLRAASVNAFRPLRLAFAVIRILVAPEPTRRPRPVPAIARRGALPLLTHSVHRRGPPGSACAA